MPPLPTLRTTYSIFTESETGRDYNDDYCYTPDALKHVFRNSQMHILSISHTLSPKSFYFANFSYSLSSKESYLYRDLISPQLQTVSPQRGRLGQCWNYAHDSKTLDPPVTMVCY